LWSRSLVPCCEAARLCSLAVFARSLAVSCRTRSLMGNAPSQETYTHGYHVLKVQPNSPGEKAGLVTFFDFIVTAGGVVLVRCRRRDAVAISLPPRCSPRVRAPRTRKTTAWSRSCSPTSRSRSSSRSTAARPTPTAVRRLSRARSLARHVCVLAPHSLALAVATLVPSMSWGGTGLIGVSIRYCALAGANEFVWHVLDVFDNSPAYRAGLISFEDYIVGTPDLLFNDAEDFSTLVQSNLDREIQLYVYNAATDTIRIVRPLRLASRRVALPAFAATHRSRLQVCITPSKTWGGEGCLGCDVGYGYLHRIPTRSLDGSLQQQQHHHLQQTTPSLAAAAAAAPLSTTPSSASTPTAAAASVAFVLTENEARRSILVENVSLSVRVLVLGCCVPASVLIHASLMCAAVRGASTRLLCDLRCRPARASVRAAEQRAQRRHRLCIREWARGC